MQRMRRGKTDTLQTFDLRDLLQQSCKVYLLFRTAETSAVIVDILSQEHHLFGTCFHGFGDLLHQQITGDTDLISTCMGNNTEST